jgi:hypothetical protein
MALQPQHRPMRANIESPDVPGYEIIRMLGAGSTGEVWLADELETDRIVALKILHRHGGAGASTEVMQREIQMLAKLVHPNLVHLHRAITTADGRQGLAMEWIDGQPLHDWLQHHSNLTLHHKLDLFHGIVRGVAFLHDHGVIHRDLKPANLIVDAGGKVKIVDFGLARLHQEGTATSIDGGSIGVSGTLNFMAPEQAANGPGARAMPVDVYALGLILHRLLMGRWLRPAEGTPPETLALVLKPPPLDFSGPAKELPRDLQWILRQALAPDPAQRYRHARDLLTDLERFAVKLPVAARKHTFLYLTTTLLRRQARRSVFAACLVLAGLAAGGTIYQRHQQVTRRSEANLRYAYNLTSFTLSQLRDDLLAAVPMGKSDSRTAGGDFPAADAGEEPQLPVGADGELDLRYYRAQLADLRSATSESQGNLTAALDSIQKALDLYCQLVNEAPDDPKRLLDAAQARLSFARLLDLRNLTGPAGGEAQKVLRQLERLAAWPGFEATSLPALHCDALRLVAKQAHQTGDSARAVEVALEMLAIAESLPSGLLVRPENETAPRLALAASDLATYAIAADPSRMPEAHRHIDRAIGICRAAYESDPESPAYTRGLVYGLHAKARLLLHADPGGDFRELIGEGADLLIGEGSRIRLSSYQLIREYAATATLWTKSAMKHPDGAVAEAALQTAARLISYLRANGGATDEMLFMRARLFLYQSHLACRSNDREKAAYAVSRALRLLLSRQENEPERISLALVTAMALHQARALAEFESGWNPKRHGPRLELLLKQLSERSTELNEEQRQELSTLL